MRITKSELADVTMVQKTRSLGLSTMAKARPLLRLVNHKPVQEPDSIDAPPLSSSDEDDDGDGHGHDDGDVRGYNDSSSLLPAGQIMSADSDVDLGSKRASLIGTTFEKLSQNGARRKRAVGKAFLYEDEYEDEDIGSDYAVAGAQKKKRPASPDPFAAHRQREAAKNAMAQRVTYSKKTRQDSSKPVRTVGGATQAVAMRKPGEATQRSGAVSRKEAQGPRLKPTPLAVVERERDSSELASTQILDKNENDNHAPRDNGGINKDDDSELSSLGTTLDTDNDDDPPSDTEPARESTCPMCGQDVDADFLEEFSGGKWMRISQQVQFCHEHKKRAAQASWKYPIIDWIRLPERVAALRGVLSDVLEGRRAAPYADQFAENARSGRNRTLLKMAGGVPVPGYYGPRGASAIAAVLVKQLGPLLQRRAAGRRDIAARGPAAYIEEVLVLEAAVCLIAEDLGVDEDEARTVLRDSARAGELVNEELAQVVVEDGTSSTRRYDSGLPGLGDVSDGLFG